MSSADEVVATLKVDLEAEIQHSQQLQDAASKAPAPAAPPPVEDSEKDALSLGLYEDLSGLAILGVSVKKTQKGRDVTFKCMQTYEDRSALIRNRNDLLTLQRSLSSSDLSTSLIGRRTNG